MVEVELEDDDMVAEWIQTRLAILQMALETERDAGSRTLLHL